jgi:integrase
MNLLDFFANVYRPNRLFGKSDNTTRLYLISIRSLGRTLGRIATIDDLTDANIRRHMEYVVSRGRSKATANKDRAQLLTLWRYAFVKGLIDRSPDVQPFPEPERVPVAWIADEMARLLDTIGKTVGHYNAVPRSLFWRAIVLIALDTGERIGAIAQARWDWLSGDQILFPAEARKGGKRDRLYRLSPETVDLLGQLRALGKSQVIFHFPFNSTYLWAHYREILTRANLPSGRRDMFHKLRRTTGSVAYAAGLDAQDVLDHQHRRTTQRYLDPRFSRKEQACDILAAYLRSPSPANPAQSPPVQAESGQEQMRRSG